VFGRASDGVGGIARRVALLLPGVLMVRPMLASFRRGGVGGFTKEGEDGAEVCSGATAGGGAKGADMMARPRLYALVVFTARFFRFRGFFAEVFGRCMSKKGVWPGSVIVRSGGLKRAVSMACVRGEVLLAGDSGEGPGDGSVMEDESRVEMVVVGDESEDSDVDVEMLSCCWWKTAKGGLIVVARSLLDRSFSVAEAWRSASSSNSLLVDSSSKTVIKDGIGAAKVRGLDCACMLILYSPIRRPPSVLFLRRRPVLLGRFASRRGVGDTSWMLGRQNSTFLGEGE